MPPTLRLSALLLVALASLASGCCSSGPYDVTFGRKSTELGVPCQDICEADIAPDTSTQGYELESCEAPNEDDIVCHFTATSCTTELH